MFEKSPVTDHPATGCTLLPTVIQPMLWEIRTRGVAMNKKGAWGNSLFGPLGLADNRVMSVTGRDLGITCLQGLLWVTWPDGQERIVIPGSWVLVRSKGKVCIQALGDSVVKIERKRWWSGLAGWVKKPFTAAPGRGSARCDIGWFSQPGRGLLYNAARPSWRA